MKNAVRRELEAAARSLGFVRFGVARVEPLDRDDAALREWIKNDHHGSMGWMRDTVDVRADPTHDGMLPSARSVLVLATPYARSGGRVGPSGSVVARYARGRDYHNVVGKRMRKLARILKSAGYATRTGVDTLPILERAWAQRAGLGFMGKNCCLIIPGVGSHVFLSSIITDAELPYDEPMGERCGSCRLCLDACPTDAFVDARTLDSRRCISYLTIEHRGPIATELRGAIGNRLFGCDDCQDVCPFNRTAPPDSETTEPFAAHDRLDVPIERLLTMSEEEHQQWGRGSPLRRAGRDGLARNAAIVLGNQGTGREALRAAESDERADVAEAAAWAVAQSDG